MAGKSKKSNSKAHLKDITPLQRWEIVHKLKQKGHTAVVIAETIGLNRRSVHKILKKPKPALTQRNSRLPVRKIVNQTVLIRTSWSEKIRNKINR